MLQVQQPLCLVMCVLLLSAAQQDVAEGAVPKGISMIARDLQTVTFYNSNGEFAGVRRTDSKKPLQVSNLLFAKY